MKKETAVEWLFDKMITEKHTISEWNDVVKQAKAMEKQQIIDAWEDGQGSFSTRTVEQYHNETYEK